MKKIWWIIIVITLILIISILSWIIYINSLDKKSIVFCDSYLEDANLPIDRYGTQQEQIWKGTLCYPDCNDFCTASGYEIDTWGVDKENKKCKISLGCFCNCK